MLACSVLVVEVCSACNIIIPFISKTSLASFSCILFFTFRRISFRLSAFRRFSFCHSVKRGCMASFFRSYIASGLIFCLCAIFFVFFSCRRVLASSIVCCSCLHLTCATICFCSCCRPHQRCCCYYYSSQVLVLFFFCHFLSVCIFFPSVLRFIPCLACYFPIFYCSSLLSCSSEL